MTQTQPGLPRSVRFWTEDMHVGMVGKQFLLMRLQNSETFGGGTVKRRCAMSEPGHTASMSACLHQSLAYQITSTSC